MSGVCKLEVHVEDYFHAITPYEEWQWKPSRVRPWTERLLKLLGDRHLHATFYVLGHVAKTDWSLIHTIHEEGHLLGSHGFYHDHHEREGDASDVLARHYIVYPTVGYRSPYWETTPRPGWSGGAFLRLLPYPLLKLAVQRSGVCWVHPYDLDPHPPFILSAPPWRYVGNGQAEGKLLRLFDDFDFRS